MYLRQQAKGATEVFEQSTVHRISNVVQQFDRLLPSQRRELMALINSPSLECDLFFQITEDHQLTAIDHTRYASLEKKLQRNIVVNKMPSGDSAGSLFESQQQVAIWVPLSDGTWVRFITASALPSLGWVVHMSSQTILAFILISLLATWAARQITRPLTSLKMVRLFTFQNKFITEEDR